MTKRISAILLLALLAAAVAMPAQAQYSGYYLEIAGGPSEIDFFDFDDEDNLARLSIGYRFNDNIAVEASYIEYGDYYSEFRQVQLVDFDVNGDPVFGLFPANFDYSPSAFGLGIVGGLPFGRHFEVYAKAGFLQWNIDFDERQQLPNGATARYTYDLDGTGLYAGVGLAYNISLHLSLRAEFDIQDWSTSAFSDNIKVNSAALGLRWYF